MRLLLISIVMGLIVGSTGLAQEAVKWTATGWGGGGFYWAAAFHPEKEGVVYLGSDVLGVYRSDDHAKTWRFINNGIGDYAIYTLATDVQQPEVLYAGTPSGYSKSGDGGASWTVLKKTGELKIFAVRNTTVRGLAAEGGNVLAGTPDGRILGSSDGGENWELLHEIRGGSVSAVLKRGNLALAATSAGVLRSENAGKTWTRVLETPAASVSLSADGKTAFAALRKAKVARSTDGGMTWQTLGEGMQERTEIYDVAIAPTDATRVYAIGSAGWGGDFYYSNDTGATWGRTTRLKPDPGNATNTPENVADANISNPRNIAVSPHNADEFYVAGNWRPCYSNDGGKTLEERIDGADISCIYDVRFAAGNVYVTVMDEGLLFSKNNGEDWTQIYPRKYDKAVAGHQWRALVWNDGQDILTTVSPWDEPLNAVLRSKDGGKTFTIVREGLPDYLPKANTMWGRAYPRGLAQHPTDPNIIYLGMDGDPEDGKSGGGIFKSTDGGWTFKQLENQPGTGRRTFFSLAIDPTNPDRIYWAVCGEGGGLYRSEDAGDSWEHVFKNETWLFNVTVGPDGSVLAPGHNLWRSTDAGKTWKQLTRRGNVDTIVAVETDPANPQRFWYATTTWSSSATHGGIWETTDAGATWTEITGDIAYRKPLILRYNADTRELWAAGAGLFKTQR